MKTAKYVNRPGPPYQANDSACRDKRKKGNDGNWYTSTVTSNGVYRWKKM